MRFDNTEVNAFETIVDFIFSSFGYFLKSFKQYLEELKKRFALVFFIFPLFVLSQVVPRFQIIIYENIAPNSVIALWVVLIYFYFFAALSAYFPITPHTYRAVKNAFLKVRNIALPASLILSWWLIFQGVSSIFSEQFLYNKLFAALFLQIMFFPLFLGLPDERTVEDFRWFRRYEMSALKKKVYFLWVIFVGITLFLSLFLLIGDIYTLPTFKIS